MFGPLFPNVIFLGLTLSRPFRDLPMLPKNQKGLTGSIKSLKPTPGGRFSSAFAVDITRPAWLQFVRRQQSVQPKQIMDYEEKTRVITKLMQSNPEETTRLERHYEEIVATYARREKTAQGQMEHLIAEIAKLKGQGD
jgi:hypothetical protein